MFSQATPLSFAQIESNFEFLNIWQYYNVQMTKKNYNITYKLSLDFRIIKTMLRVLGDFSKTGQLWNRFDDSNTKSSHQGNILTISGHLDVI